MLRLSGVPVFLGRHFQDEVIIDTATGTEDAFQLAGACVQDWEAFLAATNL
jgi:hypothetical protein